MRSTFTAMAIALTFAAPALAQKATPPAVPAAPQLCPSDKISNGARKALVAYQTAVAAKDQAAIAAADAATRAVVKSGDDRCVLGQLQLNAAANRSDFTAASAAVDAIVASGVANKTMVTPLYNTIGKNLYNAKNYAGASAAFERALQLSPNDPEQIMLLAETRAKTGQTDAALKLYRQAATAATASGSKIPEDFIKHAVAFAYDAKSPQTAELAREWVAAYPTPKNWRDAIKVYTALSPASDTELLDMYRLQRATGSLAGEGDYGRFAATLNTKGLVGEAKAVIEEGYAKNATPRSANMSALLSQASAKVAADKASLSGGATKALAGSSAKPLLTTGDALYGYGDYTKAAELYRAALTKPDVDAAQVNLRLGTALTMSGDKAGAKAAFDAVTGPKADIAKYWLVYLAQRP